MNKKLNVIIFSKDRSFQLDALLRSIERSILNISMLKINVLYTYSNHEFDKGYEKLIDKWNNHDCIHINFMYENSNFKNNLIELLKSECKFTMFLTDDDIFYKNFEISFNILDKFLLENELITFSLRLGLNTVKCYTMNMPNSLVNNIKYNDFDNVGKYFNIVKCKDCTFDFAYPLSVDGHIFNTQLINKYANQIEFSNPNIFEAKLQQFNSDKDKIIFLDHSVLVNLPINRVQNIFNNIAGVKYGFTAKDLNEMYLDDFVMDLSRMDFTNIVSPHTELLVKFKEYEK